jgi:DNA-binding MarR family transcriptional regulator
MPAAKAQARTVAHAPDTDGALLLNDLLGHRLMRLSAAIEHLADQDAGHVADLSLPEYRVLIVLLGKGPLGVAGLRALMSIDKAWISRTLGKLAEKGLVDSNPDKQDGRRTTYRLTAAGRRAAASLTKRAAKREEQIFSGFEARDRSRLIAMLDRVQSNVASLKV